MGVKQFGAPGGETIVSAVAADPCGHIHLVGHTDADLDGRPLTGTCDAFLATFDSLGNRHRTVQLGAPGRQTYAYSVATDADGNVYVTGYTKGRLDGEALAGTCDAFLAKFDRFGNRLFIRQRGARDAATVGCSVAVDRDGDIYIAGWTTGQLDSTPLAGATDAFLIRFDHDGRRSRTRQFGTPDGETAACAVTTDARGNAFVVGHTTGTLQDNASRGTSDLFLATYDRDGHWVATRQLGAPGAETDARAVATDAFGNIHVAGDTYGALDGGTRIGLRDAFLTRFDSTLSAHETIQFGHPGKWTWANALAIDTGGRIHVAGSTNGNLEGTCAGFWDLFLAGFDGPGQPATLRQLGAMDTQAHTYANGVAVDAHGNIYVAGYTNAGLAGNLLTGAWDAYLATYDACGNLR